jgi:ABC-2 type transport system permease protein
VRSAILIDFKRSLVRPATLIALVLFMLLGIGISYLILQVFAAVTRAVGFLGYYTLTNSTITITGVAYSIWGEKLGGEAVIHIENCTTSLAEAAWRENCVKIAEARASFTELLNTSIVLRLENAKAPNLRVRINVSTWYGALAIRSGEGFEVSTAFATSVGRSPQAPTSPTVRIRPPRAFVEPVPASPFGSKLFKLRDETIFVAYQVIPLRDVLKFFIFIERNLSVAPLPQYVVVLEGAGSCENVEVFYGYGNETVSSVNELSEAVARGELKPLANISTTSIVYAEAPRKAGESKALLVFRFGSSVYTEVFNLVDIQSLLKTPVTTAMVSQLSTPTTFLPVVFLYLAYVLVAKPRAVGALEFVLSMPVTRRGIYAVRFLAGVLTAITVSGVLVAVTTASTIAMLKASVDLTHVALLWLGLAISLIATYSLFYMLSTALRGGSYLAIAILAYILLWFALPIAATAIAITIGGVSKVAEVSNIIKYINPQVLFSYITSYILTQLTGESSVHYDTVLTALSTALWIATPLALGWAVFRKTNLSS